MSYVKDKIATFTPVKYNQFYWWRRFKMRETLHPLKPLYYKIKNGDYEMNDILTGPGVFFGLIQKCCNGMIFGTPEGESAELFLEAGAATLLDTENAQHWGKGWAFCQFYVGFGDFAKLDLVSSVEQAADVRTALDISPDPEEIFGDAAEH